MKERPILFTGEMVRAILQNRKSQTRRLLKPQPEVTQDGWLHWRDGECAIDCFAASVVEDCPYGKPGDLLWVRDGEGRATLKRDGTSCLVRDGKLYKRRELKRGQVAPPDFEQADFDEETGKTVGWVPVGDGPDDQYHREAWAYHAGRGEIGSYISNGTYELMGPKVQGNRESLANHQFVTHGGVDVSDVPRAFEGLRDYLERNQIEGIVWHHDDGRMAKIKRRDFGLKW